MKKFIMPYGIKTPPIVKVFKWKLSSLFKRRRVKVADDNYKLKVHKIDESILNRDKDFIIWLGHATFYIQLNGIKILTDPVFYNIPFTPRLTKLPLDIKLLKPDIILISHGHYDHLDLKSLEALKIYDKWTKVVMPLNLSHYSKYKINYTELDWYESCNNFGITIQALPASHWHRRGVFDFNKALWCSFLIKSKIKTIFFAGDTAMDNHFKEISQKIDKIDIALMPIGAYLPKHIMGDNHINPQEAVTAAQTLKAKELIPYHYGTFKLSEEPIGEPRSWIERLAKISSIKINILDVGEIEVY